jgi:hypothetical protein
MSGLGDWNFFDSLSSILYFLPIRGYTTYGHAEEKGTAISWPLCMPYLNPK